MVLFANSITAQVFEMRSVDEASILYYADSPCVAYCYIKIRLLSGVSVPGSSYGFLAVFYREATTLILIVTIGKICFNPFQKFFILLTRIRAIRGHTELRVVK